VRVVVADCEPVEGHQQPFGRGDPAAHDDPVAVLDREAGRQQRFEAGGTERVGRVGVTDRNLQEEQPDRVAERRVRQPTVEDRDVREARGRAVVAEQLDDRLLGVRQRAQGAADRVSGTDVRNGIPVLSDAASCLRPQAHSEGTVSGPRRGR
jgi:hypothetical protein